MYHLIILEQLKTNADYEQKLKKKSQSDKAMFSIAWQVEELKRICAECRQLRAEVRMMVEYQNTDFQHLNFPRRLADIREKLCLSAKTASKYRRRGSNTYFCVHDLS